MKLSTKSKKQFQRGGRGGIRTHEATCVATVFETVAVNHLATLPCTTLGTWLRLLIMSEAVHPTWCAAPSERVELST